MRIDYGGWISGPCLPPEPYGHNVGRFMRDHPGWLVAIGFESFGYRARRREGGRWVSALTLDELAELLEET